jgi:hypothetical protein
MLVYLSRSSFIEMVYINSLFVFFHISIVFILFPSDFVAIWLFSNIARHP